MIITVDVMDMSGNRLGDGPLFALEAAVTEELDGAGRVQVTLPLTDERVVSLFAVERRVKIYHDGDVMGEGVINQTRINREALAFTLTAQGPDVLNLLQRKTVLRGRVFEAAGIASVISTLAGLAGWSASTSETDVISLRLDGQSVLKGLASVAGVKGYHLRASNSTPDTVEVGPMGADSGLYVFEAVGAEVDGNPDVLMLEEIRVVEESKDILNWVEPIGGSGAGEGEQTLREAYDAGTRTSPYTIQTLTGPRGQTVYYIADAGSISTYGQVEGVRVFDQVSPLSNAAADALRGSEALYDLAAAYLDRHKSPLQTLELAVRAGGAVDVSKIRVGDKVHITYKGVVETVDGVLTWLDVDADYWMMAVTKSASQGGLRYGLRVASVDRREMGAEEILLGALEAVQVRGVSVAQSLNHYNYTYEEEVAPSHDATIPLDVTNVTRSVSRVLLRLTSRPFRATAQGTASGGGATSGAGGGVATTTAGGGDHNHKVLALTSIGGFPATSNRPYLGRNASGGAFLYVTLPTSADSDLWTEQSSGSHTHSISLSNHTHSVPNHTHGIDYGISDDTTYPAGVQVWINGTDRTAALGGPWGTVAAGIDEELDVTQYITGAATLRQRHEIVIKCTGGQGVVQGNVDVQEVITSVDTGI